MKKIIKKVVETRKPTWSEIVERWKKNLQKYIDKQIADKSFWWAIIAQGLIELKDALKDIEIEKIISEKKIK